MAKAIQDNMLSISAIEQMKADPDIDITDVEIQVINPTETMIRAKTERRGTRYFHIKLREMM